MPAVVTTAVPAGSETLDERVQLGQALQARLGEVASLVAERVAPGQRVDLAQFDTSVMATRIIARWLAGGGAATVVERKTLAENGQSPFLGPQLLAELAKSYLAWRDVTLVLIREEAGRLGLSERTLAAAEAVVSRSADSSLVRMCRTFDKTRRELESLIDEERSRLAHAALHDQLTQLPNRVHLLDQVDACPDPKQSRTALLFVDLDHFKAVNDRFGHAGGDELLAEAARRMRALVRGPDMVARFAGDEFVILASELRCPDVDAVGLAERIRSALAEPFEVSGHQLSVTASIGIAFRRPEESSESVIDRADRAMYHAKSRGRDRCEAYTEDLGADAERRGDLRHELATALERGQLSLAYQKIVDDTGRCVGAEALLRWSHPELGEVGPAEFIPLAEHSGLIVGIGDWVLRGALAQCRAWRDAGWEEATIAVNLSTVQLRPGLVTRVQAALHEAGLPASALVLEITETGLLQEGTEAMALLEELRRSGVSLAIDDFGTGYASLAHLRSLPAGFLKIDRCFISQIDTPAADSVIVRATIELGHALGLTVVAEGVETEAELAVLRRMGCDRVQGFLLGRPVPASEFSWQTERSLFEEAGGQSPA